MYHRLGLRRAGRFKKRNQSDRRDADNSGPLLIGRIDVVRSFHDPGAGSDEAELGQKLGRAKPPVE